MISPAVKYTISRLLLVGLAAGVLYLVGFRGWTLAFAAVIVSLPLSWFLLRKQREEFAVAMEENARRRAGEKASLREALRGDTGRNTAQNPSPESGGSSTSSSREGNDHSSGSDESSDSDDSNGSSGAGSK